MGLITETFLKRQWISLRAVPFPLRRKPLACSDGLLTQGQLWNDFCLSVPDLGGDWEERLQPLAGRNVFLNSQADSQIRRSLAADVTISWVILDGYSLYLATKGQNLWMSLVIRTPGCRHGGKNWLLPQLRRRFQRPAAYRVPRRWWGVRGAGRAPWAAFWGLYRMAHSQDWDTARIAREAAVQPGGGKWGHFQLRAGSALEAPVSTVAVFLVFLI